MGLFIGKRDLRFYRTIGRQLIVKIMGTTINYFKLNTQTISNLYEEGINKVFFPDVKIAGIISFSQASMQMTQIGTNFIQSMNLKFDRQYLKQIGIYPQIGDVIQWNKNDYEITSVIQNQFVAGLTQEQYNWSFVCQCILISKRNTQLQEVRQFITDNTTYQSSIPDKLYR